MLRSRFLRQALLALWLLPASLAAAEGAHSGRGRAHLWRDYSRSQSGAVPVYRVPPPESYDAGWSHPVMYPKFYGGFHYRQLQTPGYPFGTDGFRGTPW